jgi:hypothetical protein
MAEAVMAAVAGATREAVASTDLRAGSNRERGAEAPLFT